MEGVIFLNKWKYEIGQVMSLAGHDCWTHISHHKTVGMGVKFQNKIMQQFLCQKLHFEESLYCEGLVPLLNLILALYSDRQDSFVSSME